MITKEIHFTIRVPDGTTDEHIEEWVRTQLCCGGPSEDNTLYYGDDDQDYVECEDVLIYD